MLPRLACKALLLNHAIELLHLLTDTIHQAVEIAA